MLRRVPSGLKHHLAGDRRRHRYRISCGRLKRQIFRARLSCQAVVELAADVLQRRHLQLPPRPQRLVPTRARSRQYHLLGMDVT